MPHDYFTHSNAELLAKGPNCTCTGRSPLTAGTVIFTCINPTNPGAIPAKDTAAVALPTVAVGVSVSWE